MQPGWKRRALIWSTLAESARANRQAYPALPTAWLPHFAGNSVALWMPELLAALDHTLGERGTGSATLQGARAALRELCVTNPAWGLYVAPATLGYALSHPRFNIYKGRMGAWNVFGFGLDAIPHSTTAFALSLLLQRGIATLARTLPHESPWSPLVGWLGAHPPVLSALVLAALTVTWESGEYAIQQDELRRAQGDSSAINMEWSLEDTLTDIVANSAGWLAAALLDSP